MLQRIQWRLWWPRRGKQGGQTCDVTAQIKWKSQQSLPLFFLNLQRLIDTTPTPSLYSSASIFHISLNNFHLSALADWKHCWKHFSALKNTLCASYRSIPSLIQVWYLPHSESANLKPDNTDKTLIPRENMSLPSNMQLNDLSTLKKGTFTTV